MIAKNDSLCLKFKYSKHAKCQLKSVLPKADLVGYFRVLELKKECFQL